MTVRAVVFDVGEALIDETRIWGGWADWFDVPHLTLFAVLGGLIARGEDFRQLVDVFRHRITNRTTRGTTKTQ